MFGYSDILLGCRNKSTKLLEAFGDQKVFLCFNKRTFAYRGTTVLILLFKKVNFSINLLHCGFILQCFDKNGDDTDGCSLKEIR